MYTQVDILTEHIQQAFQVSLSRTPVQLEHQRMACSFQDLDSVSTVQAEEEVIHAICTREVNTTDLDLSAG